MLRRIFCLLLTFYQKHCSMPDKPHFEYMDRLKSCSTGSVEDNPSHALPPCIHWLASHPQVEFNLPSKRSAVALHSTVVADMWCPKQRCAYKSSFLQYHGPEDTIIRRELHAPAHTRQSLVTCFASAHKAKATHSTSTPLNAVHLIPPPTSTLTATPLEIAAYKTHAFHLGLIRILSHPTRKAHLELVLNPASTISRRSILKPSSSAMRSTSSKGISREWASSASST